MAALQIYLGGLVWDYCTILAQLYFILLSLPFNFLYSDLSRTSFSISAYTKMLFKRGPLPGECPAEPVRGESIYDMRAQSGGHVRDT